MLAVNQENEKLMEEYEKLASEVRLGQGHPHSAIHLGAQAPAKAANPHAGLPGPHPFTLLSCPSCSSPVLLTMQAPNHLLIHSWLRDH